MLGDASWALNTAFNNVYYGGNNNAGYAAIAGGLAGGAGYIAGAGLTQGGAQVTKPIVFPRKIDPTVPAVLQGVRNPLSGLAGATGGAIVQGGASFVPSRERKSSNK